MAWRHGLNTMHCADLGLWLDRFRAPTDRPKSQHPFTLAGHLGQPTPDRGGDKWR
jgi:hypothetical protein